MGNKKGGELSEPRQLEPATLCRTLVEATSRALSGRDCGDLAETAKTNWLGSASNMDRRRSGRAAGAAADATVPLECLDDIDSDAVAQWIVDQYGIVDQYAAPCYPAVVIGAVHGSAAHVAASIGAPWLPAAIEVDVAWAGGDPDDLDAAMRRADLVASALTARDPELIVRHVHDPLRFGHLAARQTTHHLTRSELAQPYRNFIERRVRPGAPVVLIKDERRWPNIGLDASTFQLGSPSDGLTPGRYLDGLAAGFPRSSVLASAAWQQLSCDATAEYAIDSDFERSLALWANSCGRPLLTIGYTCPSQFSAAIADLYRGWLKSANKTGNRVVVECGRLLDPYQVMRAGLVPYWCENSTTVAVDASERWLAGSEPFSSVEVLAEPTGLDWPGIATLDQWLGVALFGTRRGVVDQRLTRAYPMRPLPPREATAILRCQPYDIPMPPRLTAQDVLTNLRGLAMNGPRSEAALSGMDSA